MVSFGTINKVELYGANNDGQPRRYAIADGTQVSKAILLGLSDERTAVHPTTATKVGAGISMEGKEADDGVTSISLWTDGIFESEASGALTIGAPITLTEDNFILAAPNVASGAAVIGYTLGAASNGENVTWRLKL